MERKNTLLLTVIAIATLLVAVVGATFAYFATTVNQESTGLNVLAETEPASSVFLANGSDLTLQVVGGNMQRSQSNENEAILSNTNNTVLNVTYGASSSSGALSCTYDIVFKWNADSTDKYLYSAAVTKPTEGWEEFDKEFTITVGDATVTGFTDTATEITTVTGSGEKNIAYDGTCKDSNEDAVVASSKEACEALADTNTWTEGSVMTLVRGATIYSNTAYLSSGVCSVTLPEGTDVNEENCEAASGEWTPAGGGTVVSWPIAISFYNLPLNQNHLAGKSFAGRVEVANVIC